MFTNHKDCTTMVSSYTFKVINWGNNLDINCKYFIDRNSVIINTVMVGNNFKVEFNNYFVVIENSYFKNLITYFNINN